jgi:hypothetical protein
VERVAKSEEGDTDLSPEFRDTAPGADDTQVGVRPPVVDEDPGGDPGEVEFADQSPLRPDSRPPQDLVDGDSHLALVDCSPLAADSRPPQSVAGEEDLETDLLERSPLAADSRPPAPLPPSVRATPPQAPAPSARPKIKIEIPATGAQASYAECPACQARNPHDCLRCGRCGEEIAPATAGSSEARSKRSILLGQASPRLLGEVDAEVLPEEVRDELDRRERDSAERVRARQAKREKVRVSLMIRMGLVFGAGSIITFGWALGWLSALWLPLDVGIGAYLGHTLIRGDHDRLVAASAFGGLAVATTIGKMCFAAMAQGNLGFAAAMFPGLVLFVFGAFLVGFFTCMGLDFKSMDQEI